jgi:hypothetical protein
MMKNIIVLLAVLAVSGCALGPKQPTITDFSDRSIAYGWLDISGVDANRLHSISLKQFQPAVDKPYFFTEIHEFAEGYLYFTYVLKNGSYALYSASGQRCFLLCGNAVYSYEIGSQGSGIGRARITRPDAYALGSYALEKVKTRFYQQGKFDVVAAENGPSDEQLLQQLLIHTADVPEIQRLVRNKLNAK